MNIFFPYKHFLFYFGYILACFANLHTFFFNNYKEMIILLKKIYIEIVFMSYSIVVTINLC